jgi:hypothetical protein
MVLVGRGREMNRMNGAIEANDGNVHCYASIRSQYGGRAEVVEVLGSLLEKEALDRILGMNRN